MKKYTTSIRQFYESNTVNYNHLDEQRIRKLLHIYSNYE